MVGKQLAGRGLSSSAVLAAMGRVPREQFVPPQEHGEAYADRALPIDCGQTISQPYIVGLMTVALELTGAESVLEVGTGSGYQTAVLAELCPRGRIVSVERHAQLSHLAARVLQELGYANVKLVVADGTGGWPADAPYDRIIVTAAAATVPGALFDQLREGGILVIPLGNAEQQSHFAVRKIQGRPRKTELTQCRFVPLVGENAPGEI